MVVAVAPMTHQQGPCDLFHDPLDDMSFVPNLTAAQAEVVELLELNPDHRAHPRLTVHEMGRVDAVVNWAAAHAQLPVPRSSPEARS